ncbi:MAG: LacI family DNA-binding transcriptional regulator [Xanthomonadales bacterium]|jgi:LacI family repressor for deo operon, udp, cdd, tsx, nupC, and nupG|nr:LacI family DNA-binding transcriptional regulator [Xanthomonadales bacterium]
MSKVGIKDIAAETGVSIATVSHALRNPGRVSDETRRKVLAAAKKAGYTPNRLAASLRTARSGNIVVIIPDVADSLNGKIITGIENVARSRGYSVLLGNTQGSEKREREFAAMTLSSQADGIILMSHRMPFSAPAGGLVIDKLPPIVNGCENTGVDGIPCVSVDDRQAAIDATNHLLGLGHREIAVITGDMESASSRNRLQGFREAMQAAGLPVNEHWLTYGNYLPGDGEIAARKLMVQKDRPTSIFCFSDEMAIGCMHALQEQGFKVPGDMSVMGFDGIPFARYVTPSLTTIAQPTEEIGANCARILFDLIEGKSPETLQTFLPHELVVRESTSPIEQNRARK